MLLDNRLSGVAEQPKGAAVYIRLYIILPFIYTYLCRSINNFVCVTRQG